MYDGDLILLKIIVHVYVKKRTGFRTATIAFKGYNDRR
jgi:hypothetical protein